MQMLASTGGLEGHLVDYAEEHVAPDGSKVLAGTMKFTGLIPSCGAGVLTLTYAGTGSAPDAAREGTLHIVLDLRLLPGSGTTGLPGISAATLTATLEANPADHSSQGRLAGNVTCQEAALQPAAAAPRVATRAIFDTDGAASGDWYSCDPASPKPCSFDGHQYWYVRGDWNGSVEDRPYRIDVGLDGSLDADIERVFTGSIAGCGSGKATFVGHGHVSGVPNVLPPGTFATHETWTLAPGSTTVGFGGLLAANVTVDYALSYAPFQGYVRNGIIVGAMSCMPPVAGGGRAGATAIPVHGRLNAKGTSWPEQTACDPMQPGVCELTWTQLLGFSGGPMVGAGLDHYHFHFEPDGAVTATVTRVFMGSIAGCGSGTFSMGWGPATIPQPPDPAHPGSFFTRENPMRLVPGSMSLGFTNLTDTEITLAASLDYTRGASDPYGTYEGTVWCLENRS